MTALLLLHVQKFTVISEYLKTNHSKIIFHCIIIATETKLQQNA